MMNFLEIVFLVLAYPFAVIVFCSHWCWEFVAKYIPGSRLNFKNKIESGLHPDFSKTCRIWAKAKTVNTSLTGPSGYSTLEHLLVKVVADDPDIQSVDLMDAAKSPNAILSAYCILTLTYRNEYDLLETLPINIKESKAQIRLRGGCFGWGKTLGEFFKDKMDSLQPNPHNSNAERRD